MPRHGQTRSCARSDRVRRDLIVAQPCDKHPQGRVGRTPQHERRQLRDLASQKAGKRFNVLLPPGQTAAGHRDKPPAVALPAARHRDRCRADRHGPAPTLRPRTPRLAGKVRPGRKGSAARPLLLHVFFSFLYMLLYMLSRILPLAAAVYTATGKMTRQALPRRTVP